MMNARRVNRLLNIHIVINHIDHRLQNRRIMRGPPRAPTANQTEPSFRKTIVGVIEDSGRLPPSTLLRSP